MFLEINYQQIEYLKIQKFKQIQISKQSYLLIVLVIIQMIKFPFSLKACLTTIFTVLFLIRGLQLYLRMNRPDYRIEKIGLIAQQPFEGDTAAMYLRKIENRLKMQNFELIEMMNQTNPNLISDDAMLVVSASYSSVENTYAHLLQKIQRSNDGNSSIPFYLLRKVGSLLLQNSKSIKQEVDQLVKVLQYFTESLMIKKLTILSFQQGSLLCLRSLAIIKYDVFSIIDKLILINPFNPMIVILHGNAASFLQQTKQKILNDPVRTQLTNGTRIIIIHTIDNNPGDEKINWIFRNSNYEKVSFANSLVVQSKLMWGVYSYLKPEQYFRFQPFNEIITKFFYEDRQYGPLTIKEINYLLLYRQMSAKKELSVEKRNKILSKCVDFYMQNYSQQGGYYHAQCIRILRKQDFYFNQNTTLIIRSFHRFQVFGENFEKLTPYELKQKQTIYLLENVEEYRRIFVINPKKYIIQIQIQPVIRPQIVNIQWLNDVITEQQFFPRYKIIYSVNSEPVALCPGYTILYPSHLVPLLYETYFHFSSQFFERQSDCYLGVDCYMGLLRSITKNWSFGFNLIIFTLFCFHVVKRSTFSRFYCQLMINYSLTFIHTGESLLSENLIVISIVVVIQQFLKLGAFMSDMIYMPRKIQMKIMWIPLVFEILKYLKVNIFISPWKAIGLIFFAGTRKTNIAVLFIEFIFIMEYIFRDISNPQGLFLCCAWLALSSFQQNAETKAEPHNDIITLTTGKRLKSLKETILNLRKQVIDSIAICVMAMCLSEDGIVLHYIVDFYIFTFIIFAVHQQFNDLT